MKNKNIRNFIKRVLKSSNKKKKNTNGFMNRRASIKLLNKDRYFPLKVNNKASTVFLKDLFLLLNTNNKTHLSSNPNYKKFNVIPIKLN